jgi:hypothetical protein
MEDFASMAIVIEGETIYGIPERISHTCSRMAGNEGIFTLNDTIYPIYKVEEVRVINDETDDVAIYR